MARGLGKKRAAPGAASRLLVGMLLVSVHAAQARSADEARVCSAAPGPTNALVAKEQRQSACIELVAEPTPAFAAAPKATKSGSSWSAFLQSVPELVHGAATHLALVVGSALLLSSAVPARGSAARSSAWCVVRYLLVSEGLVLAAAPQGVARFSSKGPRADVSVAAPGAVIAKHKSVQELAEFTKSMHQAGRRRLTYEYAPTENAMPYCRLQNPSVCWGNTQRYLEVTANGPFEGIDVGSNSAPALGDLDGDGTLRQRPSID